MQGCALFGGGSTRIDESTPYQGPTITDSAQSGTHIVTLSAPTAGWSAKLDRTEKRFEVTRVFITLTQPPAGSLVAQVVTPLMVETNVASEGAIRVYVRRVAFGEDERTSQYRAAGRFPLESMPH